MPKVIAGVGVSLLVLSSVASAQPVQRLTDGIPELMERGGVPGLSLAWIEDGRVSWTGEYGVKWAGRDDPVMGRTVFEAASLSKPVVAYTALRMAARGELELDEPLWDEEGYPRLEHDPRARTITPRMVLTHTTGLPNWGGTPLGLHHEPGTRWGYSGEGFVYLATMLERRSGMALNELVEREVFKPLGMDHSSFVWRADYDELSASPHDFLGRPREKRKPGSPNAAASLHTTASDYGRFVVAVMAGEGLPPGMAREMLEPLVAVEGRGSEESWTHVSWGLGWGIQEGSRGKALWHWGDNGDFRCFVIAYPELGDGLVYFTNSNNGLSIAEALVGLAFEDEPWSLRFVDYEAWDDTSRRARIDLQRAFSGADEEGAWRTLASLTSSLSADIAEEEIRGLGIFLAQEGREELGLSVLDWGAARFESPSMYRTLAEGKTAVGDYGSAYESYEAALAMDPGLAGDLEPRMAWLREGMESEMAPVQLQAEELEEYVGQFGPRTIRRAGGQLLYSREGASSGVRLHPLSRDLFSLEGNPTFRIRFERDAQDRVTGIVGLYSDGRTDRTGRISGDF